MTTQELTAKEKQEVSGTEEQTRPGIFYVPDVDIYETDDAILMRADMPGVDSEHITVELNGDVLTIMGDVSTTDYDGLVPIHTEYNVGNYVRRFTLPSAGRYDRNAVSASIANGVLQLTIPKLEAAKPRRIEVTSAA